jgi:hypothetical protein
MGGKPRRESWSTNLSRRLFPTALLLVAFWKQASRPSVGSPGRRDHTLRWGLAGLLCGFGILVFIVVYAIRLRDYAVMKAIFIFRDYSGS